jgi:hypothetical protein
MKTSELKIGDKIKVQTKNEGIQSGRIVKIACMGGFVISGAREGYKSYQFYASPGEVISKLEEIPIEQEKIYTFTETELNNFCKAVVNLERCGYKYCVDFGYDNAVEQWEKKGLACR